MKKVLIIGAGPAGMTCAYEVLKKSQEFSVDICEKGKDVGGMCQSFHFSDFIVDLGPHRLFTTSNAVLNLWKEVLGDDLITIQRKTRIYFSDKFYSYPLDIFEALKNLGTFVALKSAISYLHRKMFPYKDDSNFESWVSNQFGDFLYKIFFKNYSEKLWGIKCHNLDSRFAKQRISGTGPFSALVAKVFGKRNRRIIESFYYPRFGNGQLYNVLRDKLLEKNCQFFFEIKPESILKKDQGYDVLFDSKITRSYDYIVATLPLDELISLLRPSAQEDLCFNLKFRSTVLVYFAIDKINIFPDQWIYIQDDKKTVGRITNFNNWSKDQVGSFSKTVVALEFWCFEDDELWAKCDKEIEEVAIQEIFKLPIFYNTAILESKILRIRKSYPIYEKGYTFELEKIQNYLSLFPQLLPIGRAGSFKYNNQDHSNLMGILAAKNIIGEGHYDLWEVNSDTYYQESAN